MSLSTLLEAAKYLDYLDSNKNGSGQRQHHQQSQPQFQPVPIAQPSVARKSARRQRSSRKDAANTMVAMSLPVSNGPVQMNGVSIPLTSGSHGDDRHHQAASLSSSFTTGSPLSSFASTALLCSKISSAASASSSTASSLSSSDSSSSSCGEILMGDNDFNQSTSITGGNMKSESSGQYQILIQQQLKHKFDQPTMVRKFCSSTNNNDHDSGQSFARYIAATPTGPQLVTMSTSSNGITSASAPIDNRIRAGHVIQAAANNADAHMSTAGTSFDSRHYSITTTSGLQRNDIRGQAFNLTTTMASSLGSDSHLSGAHGSCPPLIMASVQPMVLNTISPSAHQSIMAFQPATASSPTSSSSSYSRHRELHKTLEKNRRAHLRHCFELLKAELPASECVDKKTSHINIIKSAIRYVLALRQQECEIENELSRLTNIKFELAERLSRIRNEAQVDQNQLQTQQHTISNKMTQQSSTISPANILVGSPRMEQEHSPQPQQQPAAEQQLSFLLSRSKID